ncbi:MAG: hypothetical protein KBB37_10610 [Bacteroidia bacterium]|nr:hypothetical protein [Bacteroidia bacterium]MBP7261728.1 hypothetical protein [Bacteroidia bacterium]MBP9180895.1 hypothetical protein [Bacteroidia bacterium]MBP9725411.1 hypothetical protein [Bacteroidia bacterium]
MKARRYIENVSGLKAFDLTSDIIPEVGAGGVSFKNVLADFECILTKNLIERNSEASIEHLLDNDFFYMTIRTKGREFEIELDLFTGQISSMICREGYVGKLSGEFGIGSKMSEFIKADNNIGFDLDHSFFARSPFDGLVIYAPQKLVDSIYSATVDCKIIPDFKIETIEILSIDFAKEHFKDTLFIE